MQKIVTIGGGTGHYTLLKGLKNYDVDLTAIVNVVDNGGSSGELRTEFGILPPGDLRNCLLALSDESNIGELKDLFDYRFPETKNGKLGNHSLGNLILTALMYKHGDMGTASKVAAKILNVKGTVLPASIDNVQVVAETESGKTLRGEERVSYPGGNEKIKKMWLEPKAYLYRDAADAIRKADLTVICPGDLYGSILPNFLIKGLPEAIKQSKSKLVYVCNLVTKQGTQGYNVSDFVKKIERSIQRPLDYIVCNSKKPNRRVVDKYLAEDSHFVEPDLNDNRIILEDLLLEYQSENKTIARHDSDKTARTIVDLL